MESAIKGGGGTYYGSIDSKNGVSSIKRSAPVAGSNSLMAQSREQLTMDLSKSDSMFSSPRSKGCYVTKLKAFGLMLLFFLVTVAVGFITFHIGNCSESIFGTIGSSSSSNSLNPSSTPITKIRDVRLSKSILPTYYKIELIPYVDPAKNFSIDGKVSIKFMCLEKTNKITVHIKNITVHESSVKVMLDDENVASESNYDISVTQQDYDQLRDFYHVSVDQELSPGQNYRIYIEFEGILSDELAGFYRSSYTDKATNETRWIGITQFQATDARRAFPCFDEPGLKASFEVSLARQKNMTTLSNMDLNRTEEISDMPNWVWDHYNPSVPMSTYLVAFAVTDFESKLSPRSYSRPEFKVWARKDAISQADFASEIGPKILTYFEEYFNISFPLPKLDMVGLTDFSAGAMENWGLITYRETAMLFDPKVSSDSSKQRVAVVISHEIAHQWFGNLVTPSWWSDLWLNEGFASYVEYIGVDHVLPDWKILDQFVTDEIHEVFKLDALDSSHPISVQVHHPDEISEIFDSISYAKGASIIRMMNHFLTQSTFNKGLTNYLNIWSYNNTEQSNLWSALSDQAHLDGTLDKYINVGEIMDTWTLQKGFPVIYVDREYPTKHATFTQKKFSLIHNDSLIKEYEKYRWWIPVSYASRSYNSEFTNTQPEFWIPKRNKTYEQEVHADKDEWLILNVQETGYYRVNYDPKNWQLIVNQLIENHSAIHPVNRGQLLDDSLNLARASILSYETAFNVTQFLRNDNDYIPWETFLTNFQYISSMFQRSPSFGVFKNYMIELLEKQYSIVGFTELPNDPLITKYHRINILSTACSVGYPDCIEKAKELYSSWMNSTNPDEENPIPPNFRRLIYCNGIRYGGEKEWDFAWERYKGANVASEKAIILSALACSREPWILNRYLIWSIQPDSGIRKQDSRTVISGVAYNEIGNFLAFNFVRDKWMDIKTYFSSGFSMGRVIKAIASKLNTEFELGELKNFKQKYERDLGSSARAVDQAIESVEVNVNWMKKNFEVITEWLESSQKHNNQL